MTSPRVVSPLRAEQAHLDELPSGLDADEVAAARAAALALVPSDAEVFADDPPDRFAREVRRRAAELGWAETRARRVRGAAIAGLLASAVGAAFLVGGGPLASHGDIVVKGASPTLEVWRERAGRVEPLPTSGATASVGDRLQIAFTAPASTHGVVFSVDGRGVVSEHYRFDATVPVSGRVVVPEAFVLDDAPGFESFHLVTSDAPLDVATILDDARRLGGYPTPPPVPDGAVVTTVMVRKVAP